MPVKGPLLGLGAPLGATETILHFNGCSLITFSNVLKQINTTNYDQTTTRHIHQLIEAK